MHRISPAQQQVSRLGKINVPASMPGNQLVAQCAAGVIAAEEHRHPNRSQYGRDDNADEQAEIHRPDAALAVNIDSIDRRRGNADKRHQPRKKPECSVVNHAGEVRSEQFKHCAHLPSDSYRSSRDFRPSL